MGDERRGDATSACIRMHEEPGDREPRPRHLPGDHQGDEPERGLVDAGARRFADDRFHRPGEPGMYGPTRTTAEFRQQASRSEVAGRIGRPTPSRQRHHRLTIGVAIHHNSRDIQGQTRTLAAARLQRRCLVHKGEAQRWHTTS